MSLVRRRLSWIICSWLICQAAGIVAAPLALCCHDADSASLPDCCEGVGPGQVCPMHHKTGDTTCKMRNACAPGDSALISLSGALGVLPSATVDVNVFASGESAAWPAAHAVLRTTPPDPPPPRA